MKYNGDTLRHHKYHTGRSLPLHPEGLVLQDDQGHRQHLYLRKSLEGHAHLEHPGDDVVAIH